VYPRNRPIDRLYFVADYGITKSRRMKGDKSGTHQKTGEWGHRLGRNLLFEIKCRQDYKNILTLISVSPTRLIDRPGFNFLLSSACIFTHAALVDKFWSTAAPN
jgi:hypothetical protein